MFIKIVSIKSVYIPSYCHYCQPMQPSNNNPSSEQPSGMKKVISLMQQEFNSTDPLVLCKKLIVYINQFAQSLQKDKPSSQIIKQQANKSTLTKNVKKELYSNEGAQVIYPSRKTRWVKNITHEEQRQKYQQQKFIAFSFIEHGINYHYITQNFPNMLPKTYRCYVQAINNQTVNQMVDFLRYECNLEVQRLNRDQKRSIRTQLTKMREWLGNRDMDQLQTFYQFIRRHYDKSVEVKMDDALKLYKTILCIIRSPYVNVLQAQQVTGKDDEQKNVQGLTHDQEKAMIISYIKWRDINKVSDLMCQKYGYDMRWSFHSVKNKLKELLNASINKLIQNFKATQNQLYKNYFTDKNRIILQDSSQIELKIKLYSFYLQKKTTYVKVKDLLQKLRQFIQIYGGENSQTSLPKIQQTKSQDLAKKQQGSYFELTKSICKNQSIKQQQEQDTQEKLPQVKTQVQQ